MVSLKIDFDAEYFNAENFIWSNINSLGKRVTKIFPIVIMHRLTGIDKIISTTDKFEQFFYFEKQNQ